MFDAKKNLAIQTLAVLLLDDEHGITGEAYETLIDVLPELFAFDLNRQVKAANGRFYLPENHTLLYLKNQKRVHHDTETR